MNNDEGYLGLRGCTDARVGGLIGLLVGDALGVPFEFKTPNQLPPRDMIEMTPPAGFRRSHAGVPVGTYSDDGAQALVLLASLVVCGKLSLIDLTGRLLRWLDSGYMAVDGEIFDVGIQTANALARLRDGVPPSESGGASEWDNGNGSLMRVLPLALWHILWGFGMHRTFLPVAIGALLASSVAFAQTGAPAAASATPSAAVTAVCKDGTSYSGATLKGACRGHGGVDKKAASKASAASTGPAASMPMASSVAPAAGGGVGKVWVNNNTKVYHCPNDKYYGKTKNGAYMSEADAKAKGFHPDHGKACQ